MLLEGVEVEAGAVKSLVRPPWTSPGGQGTAASEEWGVKGGGWGGKCFCKAPASAGSLLRPVCRLSAPVTAFKHPARLWRGETSSGLAQHPNTGVEAGIGLSLGAWSSFSIAQSLESLTVP